MNPHHLLHIQDDLSRRWQQSCLVINRRYSLYPFYIHPIPYNLIRMSCVHVDYFYRLMKADGRNAVYRQARSRVEAREGSNKPQVFLSSPDDACLIQVTRGLKPLLYNTARVMSHEFHTCKLSDCGHLFQILI